MINKIELISPNILEAHQLLSDELNQTSKELGLSSGWHYLLDWTWIVLNIGDVSGKTILDAGAGIGFMQWYLAAKGANIISVDRSIRKCIPFHLIEKFNVEGYRSEDKPLTFQEIINFINRKATVASRLKSIARGLFGKLLSKISYLKGGTVKIYNQDLLKLADIPDNCIDAVISVSALEHNSEIETIKEIIKELERVLIPGGKMLVTLPASQNKDWFYSPAFSWCFSASTLINIFGFSEKIGSNYTEYKNILEKIVGSKKLKRNISLRYYLTPFSGMPGGKWDPKYIPVGVIKTKP